MKVLENENITQKECINYFKQHKYLLDKSFDGKVKAEFFEMSAKFYIEKESVLPMEIYEKITVKNIVENEDNKLGKNIYNIQKANPTIFKKYYDNKEKEIELVKSLLKENDIENKEELDLKYSNKKNINYYLIKQDLNYMEKNKNNEEEGKEADNEKEENKEIINEKDKGKENNKNVPKNKMKKSPRREMKNDNENNKSFLKKKRKRWKKEDYYVDYIGEKSILINQEDIVSQVDFLTRK